MKVAKKNYYGMENKELRKLIIADLKTLDLKRKDYSLRIKYVAYDLAINVTIKNPYINFLEIKDLLNKYEYIRYDDVNFGVLKGCNVYVNVQYEYGIFEEPSRKYEKLACQKIEEVKEMREGECIKVFENDRWTCYLGIEKNDVIVFVHSVVTNNKSLSKIISTVEELCELMFRMEHFKDYGYEN